MSGDVQPRRRKDKRRKKDELSEDSGGEAPVALEIKDAGGGGKGGGGSVLAKVIFFTLLGVLVVVGGLIVIEYRGTKDGWIDESPPEEEHEAAEEGSVEHEDGDEHEEDEEGAAESGEGQEEEEEEESPSVEEEDGSLEEAEQPEEEEEEDQEEGEEVTKKKKQKQMKKEERRTSHERAREKLQEALQRIEKMQIGMDSASQVRLQKLAERLKGLLSGKMSKETMTLLKEIVFELEEFRQELKAKKTVPSRDFRDTDNLTDDVKVQASDTKSTETKPIQAAPTATTTASIAPAAPAKPQQSERSPEELLPARPVSAEPAPAKPVPAKPVLAEPALAKPVPAKPALAEPALAEPAPAKPAPAKPAPAKPAPAMPAPAKPAPAKPAPAKPAPAKPAPAKPVLTEPVPAKPISTTLSPAEASEASLDEQVQTGPHVTKSVQPELPPAKLDPTKSFSPESDSIEMLPSSVPLAGPAEASPINVPPAEFAQSKPPPAETPTKTEQARVTPSKLTGGDAASQEDEHTLRAKIKDSPIHPPPAHSDPAQPKSVPSPTTPPQPSLVELSQEEASPTETDSKILSQKEASPTKTDHGQDIPVLAASTIEAVQEPIPTKTDKSQAAANHASPNSAATSASTSSNAAPPESAPAEVADEETGPMKTDYTETVSVTEPQSVGDADILKTDSVSQRKSSHMKADDDAGESVEEMNEQDEDEQQGEVEAASPEVDEKEEDDDAPTLRGVEASREEDEDQGVVEDDGDDDDDDDDADDNDDDDDNNDSGAEKNELDDDADEGVGGEDEEEEEKDNDDASPEDQSIQDELEQAERILMASPAKGLQRYEGILKRLPKSPGAWEGKARALDKLAESERSNKMLEECISAYQMTLSLLKPNSQRWRGVAERTADRMQFRGMQGKAIRLMEEVVHRFPDQLSSKKQLAILYLIGHKMKEVRKLLQQILERWPDDGLSQAQLGFVIKTTATTSADLELASALLQLGISSGSAGTIDGRYFFHLGDALQRLGKPSEARKVYDDGARKGLFRSADQRSLYNVDHLEARPWWTLQQTRVLKSLEAFRVRWKEIRAEGLALFSKGAFQPETESLKDTGGWGQFELYARGHPVRQNCQHAPITCSLVEAFPESRTCTRGQVKFSAMEGGTHVWAHTGPTNCRLRAHLGLQVRPGCNCSLRVGATSKSWEEGGLLVFDDSFEHEVWHNGTQPRLVLIVDFWHPGLSQHERQTLPPI